MDDNNREPIETEVNEASMLPKYKHIEFLLKTNNFISKEEYIMILDGHKESGQQL